MEILDFEKGIEFAKLNKKYSELEYLAKQATKIKIKEEKREYLLLVKKEAVSYLQEIINVEAKKQLTELIRHAELGHSRQTYHFFKKFKGILTEPYKKNA